MPLRSARRATWLLGAVIGALGLAYLAATGVQAGQAALIVAIVAVQTASGGLIWHVIRRGGSGPVETLGMGLAAGTSLSVLCALLSTMVGLGLWGWLVPSLAALLAWLVHARRRVLTTSAEEPNLSRLRTGELDRPTVIALVVAAVLGMISFVPNLLSYPLTWAGTWGKYHADMLFFESLGKSLAHLGPLDSIFTPDALVRYHWLVYAWSGQVSDLGGADNFVALTRVLPFVSVLGSCLVAITWARKLSRAWWVPSLAVVLLITGGYVGATYGVIFNFDSPSQSMTMLWLLALSWAVVIYLEESPRAKWARVAWLGLVGVLMLSLAGGKISAGVVAIAAVMFLALAALVIRVPWRRQAIVLAAVSLFAFILGYVLIVSGSANPGGLRILSLLDRASSVQGLNPISGSTGIALGTVIMIIAIAARWAGLGWLFADREHRRSPSALLALGFALAGLATVVLLSGGLNDTWFALAASAPIAVVSAAGVGEAAIALGGARHSTRVVVLAAVIAAVLYAVVTLLWLTGASGGDVFVSTPRWLGPIVAVVGAVIGGAILARIFRGNRERELHDRAGTTTLLSAKPASLRLAWVAGAIVILVLVSAPGRLLGAGSGQIGVQPGLSADAFAPIIQYVPGLDTIAIGEWSDRQVRAAAWLRDNAEPDDLLATNVTFSPLVTALSGVQTYASGVLYQAPYGRPSGITPLLDREAESWAFIDGPSAANVLPLCAAGVSWVWVDPTRTEIKDWEPWATVVSVESDVVILRLNSAACAR
jgi:hypothetical protein